MTPSRCCAPLLFALTFGCGSTSPDDGAGGAGNGGVGFGGSASGGLPGGGSGGTPVSAGSGGAPQQSAGSGGMAAAGNGGTSSGSGGAPIAGKGGSGGAPSGGNAGTGGKASGGAAGSGGSSGGASTGPKAFSQCRFHFGALDRHARDNAALRREIDYFIPGWMGQSDTFDMKYMCDQANGTLNGLVPAVVAYVIAFNARRHDGLDDCNVDDNTNLCRYGATYIRNHLETRIIPSYRTYAQGFAACYGTTKPILFFMEPDFYQYSTGGDANELSPQEAGQIMGRLVATMRQHLPNAIFSLDISPWIPNNGASWYPNFNLADFTFINTSGGGTFANNTRIRPVNDMTWAGVRRVTGKPILADTGYGVAGSPTGHDAIWDNVGNLNARIADGVVGIAQYNPNSGWPGTISSIRSQLTQPSVCP